ncbi:MAG: hypothetical protein KBF69_01360 [Saprospiraceae bacterium]|nr:hypothetical protein [Saprospiraceae bacterium]
MDKDENETIGFNEFGKMDCLEISKFIDKSQTLLFRIGKKGVPYQDGGGVLAKFNNYHFLFSAAHVTDNLDGLFIPFNDNQLRNLQGALVSSSLPESGKRADDKIDISVLQFHPDEAKELEKYYNFLDLSRIETNHQIDFNESNYYVAGTPSNQSKVNNKTRNIDSTVFAFFTKPSKLEIYAKYNLTEDVHIVVEFPKKVASILRDKFERSPPYPNGISGSGLWMLNSIDKDGIKYIDVKLVGIMIEFQDKYHRVMVSTRIKFAVEVLRNVFKLKI